MRAQCEVKIFHSVFILFFDFENSKVGILILKDHGLYMSIY